MWPWILVDSSCWALRLLIFCDIISELSGYVCSWFSPSSGKYGHSGLNALFLLSTFLFFLRAPFVPYFSLLLYVAVLCFSIFFLYMYIFMCNFLLLSSVCEWYCVGRRMQLVCAFPHPLNHCCKDDKSCTG